MKGGDRVGELNILGEGLGRRVLEAKQESLKGKAIAQFLEGIFLPALPPDRGYTSINIS